MLTITARIANTGKPDSVGNGVGVGVGVGAAPGTAGSLGVTLGAGTGVGSGVGSITVVLFSVSVVLVCDGSGYVPPPPLELLRGAT